VLVTVTEAARALGLQDENYIHRLCRGGQLRAMKVGRVWDIDPESVEFRRFRIAHKRSAAVHRAEQLAERRAVASARFDA
jgi:hypothetical protein